MARKIWVRDVHAGGTKVPPLEQAEVRRRIEAHAAEHYAGKYTRLDISFRGALCYIDAYQEPDVPSKDLLKATGETRVEYMERLRNAPTHLCRLRHFQRDEWSLAFYTYSHEKYEPTFFETGHDIGTPEEGFDVGAVYLQ